VKILIATPEFVSTGGGIATYYRELAIGLLANGAQVEIIEGSALSVWDGRTTEKDGIPIHKLDRNKYEKYLARFQHLSAVPLVARHLAASWAMADQMDFGAAFDIVEATDWGLLFAPFVVSGRVPVNVQCHASIGQIGDHDPIVGSETDISLAQSIESQLLARCQSVQTYSRANAAFWSAETRRQVDLQYPAYRPGSGSEVKATNEGLVVGRFQRWKGPHVLAEALTQLGNDAPSICWVGRDVPWGSSRQKTTDYIKQTYPNVIGSKLDLIGPMAPSEVRKRQASARFNLVPSTWDVFNFTAVEALDSGRPALISQGAGASELVQNGKNGYLFDPMEPSSLASAIRQVMELSDAECDDMGAAGRETVQQRLEPAKVCQQRLELYSSLMGDEHAVSGWAARFASPLNEPGDGRDLKFLDNISMKKILNYLKDRSIQKLTKNNG